MVNELVIDMARKDVFNGLEPTGDAAALDTAPEVARLLTALFGVRVPRPWRLDLRPATPDGPLPRAIRPESRRIVAGVGVTARERFHQQGDTDVR